MSLALVLTVASLALSVDAGYQYNIPTPSLTIPGILPTNFQKGHSLQQHTVTPSLQDGPLSHSISYKNYVYLKNDNGYGRIVAPNTAGTVANNGYVNTGYAQSYAPNLNLDTNHVHNFASVSNNLNRGNIHNVPIISDNANGGYAQPGPSYNIRYPQNLLSSSAASINGGYTQTSSASAAHTLEPIISSQTSTLPASISLNNAYSYAQVPSGNLGLSQGNTQTATPSAVSNLNIVQHGQAVSKNVGLSNNYLPTSIPYNNGNLNSDYLQSFAPSSSSVSTHGVTQIPLTSGAVNTNSVYTSSISSGTASLSNEYSQVASSSSSNGVNSGISQIASAQINSAGSNNAFISNRPISESNSAEIAPAVFKHIYVHVPPTDAEEQNAVPPPPPPKKNYKIIFIKVPSQRSTSNLVRSQQLAGIRNSAAVEHKTLIYVLVKNPDGQQQQQVVTPKPTPSEHEVFFVKYNGNPLDIAAQVNEELDKSGSVQSIVPLEPGLVNGHNTHN